MKRTISDNNVKSYGIEKAYRDGHYIVAYKSVYQPFKSAGGQYYAREVYYSDGSLTRRGRHFHFTGDYVNRIIGFELLNNLT